MPQILNGQTFDSDTVAPSAPFTPIPSGDYDLVIIESDVERNAKDTGDNLKLTIEIASGEFQGRKIFETLCITHEKADTQRIAQATLSSICRAVGVPRVRSSEELHGKVFRGKVGIQKGKDGYDDRNKVKEYYAKGSVIQAPGSTSGNAAAEGTSAKGSRQASPPWRKG